MKQPLGPWDDIIGTVAHEIPQFNDFMLKEFRKREVGKSKQFMDIVYKEACAVKPYDNCIKYLGYRVLSPEERIEFKVNNPLIKGQYDIQDTELELVEFLFEFDHQKYSVHLYLPYMHNDCITISNTQYHIQLAIIEKTIYRVRDGVIIKVLRAPLHFWRNETISFKSVYTGEVYHENIPTVKAFHRKGTKTKKRDMKSTILLYLLCRFGLYGTLERFGLTKDDICFTSDLHPDKTNYECFMCKPNVFLSVKRTQFKNFITKRIVASLLYMLRFFQKTADGYTIDMLNDVECRWWKVILGKYCYGMSVKPAMAINHAEPHLASVSTLLDAITKRALNRINIPCENIYDMFQQVFINLDDWLVNHQSNDLYDKKIGVLESLLSDIVKSTFTRFYDQSRQQKIITAKSIRRLLKMHNKSISRIYINSMVRCNPSIYNDNWLLSIGGKKVRERANQFKNKKGSNLLHSKEHRLDPSMVVVESITTIPSSSPGVGGSINPFCVISHEDGSILRAPWSKDVDGLSTYIPQ